ncbi:MAG: ATP-binding protein [Saprospiraceae bacterium]|nr:ATP-binding protein [Saprospiraceae bacterium]
MKRYPGIRPFRTDEQALFFGRDADIERLFRLLELEQLVILYGKSGYGKSSLLSAGIFPLLEKQNKRRFWEIRFGPYKPGESLPPAEVVRHALARHAAPGPLVADALAGPGIWQAVKNCQRPDQAAFLLVFDQFEELFSYPPEQILEFKKQLAEALYAKVPRHIEAALARAPLSPDAEDALYTPFDLKVVFSIRADRMSLLNGLKDYLPNLLQHGYELDALDEASAREAVCRPAALSNAEFGMRNAEFSASAGKKDSAFHIPHSEFDTPPFSYAPETLAAIFDALRDARGRIETSALQIICRYVEENLVVAPGQCIGTADLSDIPSIFGQFYYRTIANLPKAEQTLARRLVEDQLVKDGLRVPYAAQALLAQPGITQDLLDRLSAASLLRVQRDEAGRMIYEVGHDTLVGPIGEVAKARRAEEERERLQRDADEQRREKEKAVIARRRARLVDGPHRNHRLAVQPLPGRTRQRYF